MPSYILDILQAEHNVHTSTTGFNICTHAASNPDTPKQRKTEDEESQKNDGVGGKGSDGSIMIVRWGGGWRTQSSRGSKTAGNFSLV